MASWARRRGLLGSLGLVLLVALGAAPPDVAEPTEVKYTRIHRLPKAVTLAHLSNGLTVIVQENHVAPVATVRCYVKNTGSAFEGKWLGAGLSHVLEHVVAGGTTTKRSERQIAEMIDTFGGATNRTSPSDPSNPRRRVQRAM